MDFTYCPLCRSHYPSTITHDCPADVATVLKGILGALERLNDRFDEMEQETTPWTRNPWNYWTPLYTKAQFSLLNKKAVPSKAPCDHVEGGEIAGYERNEWLRFTFCPKCGEKL